MKIHTTLIAPIILSLGFCAAPSAFAQDETRTKPKQPEMSPERKRERLRNIQPLPTGTNFTIEAVPGPYVQYTILLTDAENHTLSGNFVRPQIDIFEALLLAARQFALTEEEVGTKAQPKVTRFMDKNEKGFVIDVQKTPQASRFYLTLHTLFGKMMIDAGTVLRVKTASDKEPPAPLFYKIIERVQEAKKTDPMPQQQVQQ
jgi:hypothetical protein